MLIAATSGRALAEAACRSGYAPLVVDAFADLDMRAVALAAERTSLEFDEQGLVAALRRLSDGRTPIGLVYGSGFEDRPHLLETIAHRWRILGNSAATVKWIKDPFRFADLCRRLGIPHPDIAAEPRSGWLSKKIGGAGGGHVGAAGGGDRFYQRCVAGESVSALFLADGRTAQVIGFSRQWTSPTFGQPWRYGGAVRPAGISDKLAEALTSAVMAVVAETGLKGLNSADFIVSPFPASSSRRKPGPNLRREDSSMFESLSGARLGPGFRRDDEKSSWWLIEINPRPGATLDIFACDGLFEAHLAACGGRLPSQPLRFEGATAAAVVYVDHDIAPLLEIAWPDWASDRQEAASALRAGDPLCTVRAEAPTAAAARRRLLARHRTIMAKLVVAAS